MTTDLPPPPNPTLDAIYQSYEDDARNFPSARIGASFLGTECDRAIWYTFRWATQKRFIGRMLRLFKTGFIQEARMVADLRRAGVTVLDIDPSTGKQWTYLDDTGHVVCKIDGAMLGLLEAPATWHCGEFKSSNLKKFKELQKKGVLLARPEHWLQTQLGMHFSGMTRGYYLAVCKDDEQFHAERLEYDMDACMRAVARGQRIAFAERAPSRISERPDWWQCKFCDHHAICHEGDAAPRNCRTCLHATPVQGGGWHCRVWDRLLTWDEQKVGCAYQRYVPDFVPGAQTDVTDHGDGRVSVRYVVRGQEWVDDGT